MDSYFWCASQLVIIYDFIFAFSCIVFSKPISGVMLFVIVYQCSKWDQMICSKVSNYSKYSTSIAWISRILQFLSSIMNIQSNKLRLYWPTFTTIGTVTFARRKTPAQLHSLIACLVIRKICRSTVALVLLRFLLLLLTVFFRISELFLF